MAFIPKYILILLATIIGNYIAARYLERLGGKKKTVLFIITIIGNLAFLGFFKYYNFFIENINTIAQVLHWNYAIPLLNIILPLGLSFHTFQSLSYIIEVFRGKQQAERHLGIYALYVLYYPQLVAGPIERPQNLLPQFHAFHPFDHVNILNGTKRLGIGLFKKTVVADTIAPIVSLVYANPQGFDGPTLIFATILFAFQLYCDFSGYSDIALGSSQVLGIRLMENFERPYFSKSIAEFWRRWHISLSSWLRDYVYFPIALYSKKPTRTKLYVAIAVTFLLSGLWHGAAWNYVCMGALFGFYIIVAEATKHYRGVMLSLFGLTSRHVFVRTCNVFITFFLVCIGWVFFRASSTENALYIISHMPIGTLAFIEHAFNYHTWKNLLSFGGLVTKANVLIALYGILVVVILDIFERNGTLYRKIGLLPVWGRYVAYYVIILSILTFGHFGVQEFIYFQF
jgi:D-alanyl-lipoteichoic acid acyltransferase DltB (MBOAT superfamily)